MRKRWHLLAAALAALALQAVTALGPAAAQEYPNKPLRIIVPFSPGASNDTLARITADALTPRLGQPVVVENKPGAGSAIGVDFVAKSPADGYTFLWAASDGISVLPAVKANLPYSANDFTYLAQMFDTSFMVVINSKIPASNMAEFVAYLKANPGKVRFGTSGAGSLAHLALALMEKRLGVKMVHVPYKGMAGVVTDILGGHIEAAVITPPTVSVHKTSDKIRIIGTTGSKRTPLFPDLPTFKEAGLPEVVVEVWYGLVGPANLPANVAARMQKEIVEILKDPEVLKKYKAVFFEPTYQAAEPFRNYVLEGLAKWKEIAASEKIVMEE
jgi:tripartite-type tricarboxylate transporter receptor subunit TctC